MTVRRRRSPSGEVRLATVLTSLAVLAGRGDRRGRELVAERGAAQARRCRVARLAHPAVELTGAALAAAGSSAEEADALAVRRLVEQHADLVVPGRAAVALDPAIVLDAGAGAGTHRAHGALLVRALAGIARPALLGRPLALAARSRRRGAGLALAGFLAAGRRRRQYCLLTLGRERAGRPAAEEQRLLTVIIGIAGSALQVVEIRKLEADPRLCRLANLVLRGVTEVEHDGELVHEPPNRCTQVRGGGTAGVVRANELKEGGPSRCGKLPSKPLDYKTKVGGGGLLTRRFSLPPQNFSRSPCTPLLHKQLLL